MAGRLLVLCGSWWGQGWGEKGASASREVALGSVGLSPYVARTQLSHRRGNGLETVHGGPALLPSSRFGLRNLVVTSTAASSLEHPGTYFREGGGEVSKSWCLDRTCPHQPRSRGGFFVAGGTFGVCVYVCTCVYAPALTSLACNCRMCGGACEFSPP